MGNYILQVGKTGMTHADKEEFKEIFDLKLNPIMDKLSEHHETLYGNGKEGLKVQVDRLEQEAKRNAKSQAFRMTLWIGAVIAGIGGIINLAVGMLK